MCLSRKYPYSPTDGIGISWGGAGVLEVQKLEKCTKLNWDFKRGGEVFEKKTSMGEVWIYSGTAQ